MPLFMMITFAFTYTHTYTHTPHTPVYFSRLILNTSYPHTYFFDMFPSFFTFIMLNFSFIFVCVTFSIDTTQSHIETLIHLKIESRYIIFVVDKLPVLLLISLNSCAPSLTQKVFFIYLQSVTEIK